MLWMKSGRNSPLLVTIAGHRSAPDICIIAVNIIDANEYTFYNDF